MEQKENMNLKLGDFGDLPLGFYFNNSYEKSSRHIDTFLVDNPSVYENKDKLQDTVERNEYKLTEDLLKQIDKLEDFLNIENKEEIWELIDSTYQELEFYNLIGDIDKYIEFVYFKQIDQSRRNIK